MAERTKSELKDVFSTGDTPTQTNFADLIDSVVQENEVILRAEASVVCSLTTKAVVRSLTLS